MVTYIITTYIIIADNVCTLTVFLFRFGNIFLVASDTRSNLEYRVAQVHLDIVQNYKIKPIVILRNREF